MEAADREPTPSSPLRAGSLLVGEPYGRDPYFGRAVILLTEHRGDGTVGFILDKRLEMSVSDLIEGISGGNYSLCLGGPVEPSTLHYLHTLGDVLLPGAQHVAGKLYWGGDFATLKQLIAAGEAPPGRVRFFIGYSGWSRGQLQAEIDRGDWGVIPGAGQEVIAPNPCLWFDLVETSPYAPWALIPEEPEDN